MHYPTPHPEKRHHPKEDAFLFGPLRPHARRADAALDRLEAEHAQADARIAQVLEAAVKGYAQDPVGGFEAFKTAFQRLRRLLPQPHDDRGARGAAADPKHFTVEDWARATPASSPTIPRRHARQCPGGRGGLAQIFSRLVAAAACADQPRRGTVLELSARARVPSPVPGRAESVVDSSPPGRPVCPANSGGMRERRKTAVPVPKPPLALGRST